MDRVGVVSLVEEESKDFAELLQVSVLCLLLLRMPPVI